MNLSANAMDCLEILTMPPPELPNPATKALDVPTMFLSKKPVDHTWQGTKLPPSIPTKNRTAMS